MLTLDEVRRTTTIPGLIADQQGIITYVNGAFERVFGWAASDIVGQPLSIIIPPVLRDAHHLGFSRFLTTGAPTLLGRPLMLRAMTNTGREFDAEHLIVAEQQHGQWIFGATIRPLA